MATLIFVPKLGLADSTVTASATLTSQTATVLEVGDPRIKGPQSCGTYSVTFIQPDEAESGGTWSLTEQATKIVLFQGEWARHCTLSWSADCKKLAFSVAWGSNAEDFAIYDMKSRTKVDPTNLVNLGLPKDASILHFYWEPVKWSKRGEFIFKGHGDYYRKSEETKDGAKGYGIEGKWAYTPDGKVRTISLKPY